LSESQRVTTSSTGKQMFTNNGDADKFRNYTINTDDWVWLQDYISRAGEDSGWLSGD
jgi:hypothetical protein